MMATADLLVLVLWVLPGKIREWLNAERNLLGKRKEGAGTSDSARENRESGQARWPAGSACSFAGRGKGGMTKLWRGGEVFGGTKEAEFSERGIGTY
jgi:hypothetical protein